MFTQATPLSTDSVAQQQEHVNCLCLLPKPLWHSLQSVHDGLLLSQVRGAWCLQESRNLSFLLMLTGSSARATIWLTLKSSLPLLSLVMLKLQAQVLTTQQGFPFR